MTREFYMDNPHYTYGGRVYEYDFDGYNSMADIAARIETDRKFDKQCEKNAKLRDQGKLIDNYKSRKEK